jgi:hypothetical protein
MEGRKSCGAGTPLTRRSMTGVIQLSDNPAAHREKNAKNSFIFPKKRIFATSLL